MSGDDQQRGDLTTAQWREFDRLRRAHGLEAASAYMHAIRRAAHDAVLLRVQDTRLSARSAAALTFAAHLVKSSLIVLPCTAILGMSGLYVSGGIALCVSTMYAAGAYVDRRLL